MNAIVSPYIDYGNKSLKQTSEMLTGEIAFNGTLPITPLSLTPTHDFSKTVCVIVSCETAILKDLYMYNFPSYGTNCWLTLQNNLYKLSSDFQLCKDPYIDLTESVKISSLEGEHILPSNGAYVVNRLNVAGNFDYAFYSRQIFINTSYGSTGGGISGKLSYSFKYVYLDII